MTIRAIQELIWELKEIAALMISGHEVHPTSLSGYDIQQKIKQLNMLSLFP